MTKHIQRAIHAGGQFGAYTDPSGAQDPGWPALDRALRRALARPALFLSASVPGPRAADPTRRANGAPETSFVPEAVFRDFAADWPTFCGLLVEDRSAEIRRAIAWIVREAFDRGYLLIFGGHPLVSPMVLDLAMRMFPADGDLRILLFQSLVFEDSLTAEANDLACWKHGCMVLTEPRGDPDSAPQRLDGLTRMRNAMIGLPNIRAGVFIGGMSGCLEESALFARHHPTAPGYAVGSTGGAARFLLNRCPAEHGGRSGRLVNALATEPSYGALALDILADIGP